MKTFHIITAFCIGLLLGHLMFQNKDYVTSPSANTVSQIRKKAFTIDTAKLSAQTFFNKRNVFLKNQLQITTVLLTKSRRELTEQRNRLLSLTSRIPADTAHSYAISLKDSLISQVTSLNNTTDSVISGYEQKLIGIGSIVAVRDSELVVCNQSYKDIKGLIEEQAFREQKLTHDLNTALKQQNHKRLENKILSVSLLFFSGIATSLIIKSVQ